MVTHLQDFISEITPYARADNTFISDLLSDCNDPHPNKGQIGKSIEKEDWFVRWGKHYLRSTLSSYQLEWCLNYKDSGNQHFTSATIKDILARIEELFCTLPAPTPSITHPAPTPSFRYTTPNQYLGGAFAAAAPAPAPAPRPSMTYTTQPRYGVSASAVAAPAPAPAPAPANIMHSYYNASGG